MNEHALNLPVFERVPDAVVIDLDGTLLNSNTQLSERNRVALMACIARGIPVIIATSRATRTARRAIGDGLWDKCSRIIMNGTMACGVPPLTGEFREPFPPGVAKEIVDILLCLYPEARLTVELEGYEFGSNRELSPEQLWNINAATPGMVVTIDEAILRCPVKIAVSRMGDDISDLADVISQQFGQVASVLPANKMTFLNIISKKASKSEALRRLIMPSNSSLNNVLAFGDDIPDIDMLNVCGISVAMANCVPEVRAVSRYFTASNDEDGVAIVLESFL